MFILGSGGSRNLDPEKRHRILDPDPQHWEQLWSRGLQALDSGSRIRKTVVIVIISLPLRNRFFTSALDVLLLKSRNRDLFLWADDYFLIVTMHLTFCFLNKLIIFVLDLSKESRARYLFRILVIDFVNCGLLLLFLMDRLKSLIRDILCNSSCQGYFDVAFFCCQGRGVWLSLQPGPLRDQGHGPDVGHLHHQQGNTHNNSCILI
jgi:hypothetical protein